ncbi:MAG: Jag N-terminal domain-containing protein [Candidatus Omnitrophota bacterium]
MENSKKKRIKPTEFEIEGKTVEEAVEKAVNLLKVNKKDLRVRVLSEEKKGLFGMEGSKPAKIIVSVERRVGGSRKSA